VKVRRWLATSAAVVTMALTAVACDSVDDTTSGQETAPATESATMQGSVTLTSEEDPAEEAPADGAEESMGEAAETLETLAVKGRAPKTGYDRDEFGPAWADVDHNGCDTRNDILNRDLAEATYRPGTQDCIVTSGVLQDPFTGTEIQFVRGQDTSSAVQIDHVVALSDAWQKGAQQLNEETRRQFSNDPLNLLAVDGPSNSRKGDGDAATWLPPNRSFRCDYVARQIAVKARYALWVTPAEKDAMHEVLGTCPGHPLPDEVSALNYTEPWPDVIPPLEGEPAPAAPPVEVPAEEAPAEAASLGGGADPRFGTCREAIAAGYGPYTEGIHEEYDWYRDGDGDGVTCER
jgi:hypothetical protein